LGAHEEQDEQRQDLERAVVWHWLLCLNVSQRHQLLLKPGGQRKPIGHHRLPPAATGGKLYPLQDAVAPGVPGELLIGAEGVVSGQLNNSDRARPLLEGYDVTLLVKTVCTEQLRGVAQGALWAALDLLLSAARNDVVHHAAEANLLVLWEAVDVFAHLETVAEHALQRKAVNIFYSSAGHKVLLPGKLGVAGGRGGHEGKSIHRRTCIIQILLVQFL